MNKRQQAARSAWLQQASALIYKARPEFSGRLEWDDLIYFFNTGLTPEDAAQRYVATRTPTI